MAQVIDQMQLRERVLALIPPTCPSCDSKLDLSPDLAHLRCLNAACGGRLARQLEILAKALDMKMLGPANCQALVASNFVLRLHDLFSLTFEGLSASLSPGIAAAVWRELESAKTRLHKPWRVLGSVGILRLGPDSAKRLILHLGSLDKALKASPAELAAGLGLRSPELIAAMSSDLEDKREEVLALLQAGIRTQDQTQQATQQVLPVGKTNIVVTGDLDGISREDLAAQLEELGVKLAGAVSRNTAWLVTNNASTQTSKARKARELGVPIINQAKLFEELEITIKGESQ